MGFEKFGQGAETGLGGFARAAGGNGSVDVLCGWVKRDRFDIIIAMGEIVRCKMDAEPEQAGLQEAAQGSRPSNL